MLDDPWDPRYKWKSTLRQSQLEEFGGFRSDQKQMTLDEFDLEITSPRGRSVIVTKNTTFGDFEVYDAKNGSSIGTYATEEKLRNAVIKNKWNIE